MEEEEEGEEEKQKAKSDIQTESTEPAADEPGTSTGSGRFYDCIFCKRGFTTAQALGGHMNIHRKDRARLQPTGPSTSSPKRGERAYHPYARPQSGPVSVSKQTADQSYVVYFPVLSGEGLPTEVGQAGDELQLGLGRKGPKEKEKEEEGKKMKEVMVEEDLDLELRLGQRKSHDSSSSDL